MNNLKEHAAVKQKVLIVDDNSMNTELLKIAVEDLGKYAVISHSGIEALELIEQERFDLVLLDIMMPKINGFDVIKRLQENKKTAAVPVIFVSALSETSDVVKGLNLGSYGYIKKPYDVEELKAKVQNVLRIKSLQDELRTEKVKLDLISEYSADGIVLLNKDLQVLDFSNQFLKWMDLPKSEVLGKKFCSLMDCEHNKIHCIDFFEQNKDGIHSTEFCIKRSNKTLYFSANCSKIQDSESEMQGYLFILRDVSLNKEIENQKETFIATLTHDLKTPVRAEIKTLEMLLNNKFGEITDLQREILQETLYSSKFMFNMIDTLLSKYKYDNGNITLNKEAFDVNSLIKICSQELKHLAEDKKIVLKLEFQNEEQFIKADYIEIKRLVINLLSNAISYTQEEGYIILKTELKNNNFEFSCIDNGRGISKEDIKCLFDKYISSCKKFRQVGTGLGLYVVKQIANIHGGDIYVESEENVGSCFKFVMPTDL